MAVGFLRLHSRAKWISIWSHKPDSAGSIPVSATKILFEKNKKICYNNYTR